MILDLITFFSSKFYKNISLPFYKVWCVFIFFIKFLFFGHENAFQLLSSLDEFNLVLIMKLLGAKIGYNCNINSGIRFHNCENLRNFEIGDNCHVGKDCFFDLREKIKIGNNVVIAMNNTFITHLDMSNSKLSDIYPAIKGGIIIKDNVYIASNCNILMGVTIEDSSFVAASSLVNKNVETFTLVGGVPAKKIKTFNGV